ncbi:MAG: hypothetical protein J6U70_00775 [Bacteroidales bacterium]|nr:hypothetical protein [Bacteroidales bacterium]
MEGLNLSENGLVRLGPSEMVSVCGGSKLDGDVIRKIIGILIGAIATAYEYLDDFIKGFKRGWDTIKMEAS